MSYGNSSPFPSNSPHGQYQPPRFDEDPGADESDDDAPPPEFLHEGVSVDNESLYEDQHLTAAPHEFAPSAGPSTYFRPPINAHVNFQQPLQQQQQQQRVDLRSGYQPPEILFDAGEDDDDDDESDNGEAPASIRFEMEPLNSNRRSSQFPPRGLDRLGISRRPLRERTSSFPGLSGNLGSSIGLGRPSNPKDRALRFWTQADNMDKVLISIYQYFEGKGIYSIVLSRVIKTLMKAFLVIFSTFLFFCIDYSLIHQKNMLSEIVRPSCMSFSGSGLQSLIILGIFAWFATEFVLLLKEVPRLVELSNFYTHVLGIPEGNIQTSTWADVTAVLTTLPYRRGTLNAHTVANRIMRRDNYMIALFNKDLLNFTLPVPYFRGHQFLTRITEFILLWCLWGIVFDRNWRIKKKVLEGNRREALVTELNTRFAQVALVALLCSPFLLVWLLMFFFFRYTEEFHKNPSSLGTRQYSPLAKWKFREFNELPHLFQKRLNRSYRLANKYMNQFPNSKVTSVANFVSFVTGSFLSVLIIATLLSEDLQHRFEITPARSVFFYIGIFATITAVARGMVPDENEVFEPALLLRNVIEEVRYIPDTWRDKLHTNEVRGEFGALLPFKLLLFLEEVASVAFAPIIFFYSLPTCAGEIIDFFREFTVHVDGIGYVCSFAVWDFRKFGNAKYGAPTQGRNDYYSSKGGKMEQSFLNFKANNPDWDPGEEGSQYLNAILARAGNAESGNQQASGLYYPGAPGDPGVSSSLLIHSLLRPKRSVKFDGQSTRQPQMSPPRGQGAHLQVPHPSDRSPHPLAQSAVSSGFRQTSQQDSMMLSESVLGGDEKGTVGRTLFALLEKIYQENRTPF